MKNRLSSVVGPVLAAIVLGGCAIRPVSDSDNARMSKIAVVSALGGEFNVDAIGTTVFNNSSYQANVGDWEIDKFVGSHVSARLNETPRFQVNMFSTSGISAESTPENLIAATSAIVGQGGFDTAVVIYPTHLSNEWASFTPGYGLHERSLLGFGRRCIYALYRVSVIDVKSKREIAAEFGGKAPCVVGSDGDIQIKPGFDQYSPAEIRLIRSRLEKNLADGLDYSLAELKLTH